MIFADSYRLSEEAKLLEQDLKDLLDPEVSINTIFRNIRMLTSEALQKFSQQLKKVYTGKHIR